MAKGLKLSPHMTVRKLLVLVVFIASAARADWRSVAPGVDYQEYREGNYDVYVTRVDVTSDQIRIVVSPETAKGTKVSDYAKKVNAVAAINGDYFDDKFNPVGLTVGACGPWSNVKDMKREVVLEIANQRGVLRKRADLDDAPPSGVDAAISGWPVIVNDCKALSSKAIPGSDSFTRSPHPRTALGISNDGTLLYFVVADGRRTGVPGLTLAELAQFMADKLSVCSAMNLDGGGSAAMWVGDHIVNRPSDGVERPVGDHLAVVLRRDFNGCDSAPLQKTSSAAQK
jgi:exopolysaccharide biosynthesis protein